MIIGAYGSQGTGCYILLMLKNSQGQSQDVEFPPSHRAERFLASVDSCFGS